ncbi:hypothetical protein PR048_024819 [Dryococelus australis]|uniref:Uncharacterized protein n=1 Tax=Dryococelus australis TaxID=614101 RepID=A0ABQ9GPM7_9NEOP|nr:hypothetical protein PR048_024819 [Dryococelus australis]
MVLLDSFGKRWRRHFQSRIRQASLNIPLERDIFVLPPPGYTALAVLKPPDSSLTLSSKRRRARHLIETSDHTIDSELQCQTVSLDFVIIGLSGLPPNVVANLKTYSRQITNKQEKREMQNSGECKGGVKGRSLKEPANQRRRRTRLPRAKILETPPPPPPPENRTRFALEAEYVKYWATLAESIARSPPTKVNRAQSPAGNRIFESGSHAGRCHWSAGLLRDLPFPPPLHSDAAPHSLQSLSLALKTSLLRAAQISSLFTQRNVGISYGVETSCVACLCKFTRGCACAETLRNSRDCSDVIVLAFARLLFESSLTLLLRYAVQQPAEIRPMEKRRIDEAGETGDHRGNRPTSGIALHDSHSRKSGVKRPGDGTRFALLGGEQSIRSSTVRTYKHSNALLTQSKRRSSNQKFTRETRFYNSRTILTILCIFALEAKKRGSDMGDTNTHAWRLIAPTRKACSCVQSRPTAAITRTLSRGPSKRSVAPAGVFDDVLSAARRRLAPSDELRSLLDQRVRRCIAQTSYSKASPRNIFSAEAGVDSFIPPLSLAAVLLANLQSACVTCEIWGEEGGGERAVPTPGGQFTVLVRGSRHEARSSRALLADQPRAPEIPQMKKYIFREHADTRKPARLQVLRLPKCVVYNLHRHLLEGFKTFNYHSVSAKPKNYGIMIMGRVEQGDGGSEIGAVHAMPFRAPGGRLVRHIGCRRRGTGTDHLSCYGITEPPGWAKVTLTYDLDPITVTLGDLVNKNPSKNDKIQDDAATMPAWMDDNNSCCTDAASILVGIGNFCEFNDIYDRLHSPVYAPASDVCSLAAAAESKPCYAAHGSMALTTLFPIQSSIGLE